MPPLKTRASASPPHQPKVSAELPFGWCSLWLVPSLLKTIQNQVIRTGRHFRAPCALIPKFDLQKMAASPGCDKCRSSARAAVLSCHVPERAGQSVPASQVTLMLPAQRLSMDHIWQVQMQPRFLRIEVREQRPQRPPSQGPQPESLSSPKASQQCYRISPTTDRPQMVSWSHFWAHCLHKPPGRSSCRAAFARTL